ncbi:unnamed protein product [Didymodactylos carnosus]|uniref:Uncharacterized protein n=1 Tax=Didymodactylos carnosus TaxID=1234261 RepID=A0A815T7V2_9BILA|nr:unnamed protein product [Didymodactylos carnosus]CAF4361921.1 unnamed protein product [Didymodactylos carnosus]
MSGVKYLTSDNISLGRLNRAIPVFCNGYQSAENDDRLMLRLYNNELASYFLMPSLHHKRVHWSFLNECELLSRKQQEKQLIDQRQLTDIIQKYPLKFNSFFSNHIDLRCWYYDQNKLKQWIKENYPRQYELINNYNFRDDFESPKIIQMLTGIQQLENERQLSSAMKIAVTYILTRLLIPCGSSTSA